MGRERDVAEDFLAGSSRRVKRIGPKFHELLDDVDPFAVRILGRMAFAESPMAESPITQGAVRIKIAADLGLPSGDDARKQMFLPLGLQNRQLPLDFRADQPRAVFHCGHDGGTVETHLGRKPGGLGTPIRAPARVGDLLPVRRLDVVGIGQAGLCAGPKHIESSM